MQWFLLNWQFITCLFFIKQVTVVADDRADEQGNLIGDTLIVKEATLHSFEFPSEWKLIKKFIKIVTATVVGFVLASKIQILD